MINDQHRGPACDVVPRKYGGMLNFIQQKHGATFQLIPYTTMHWCNDKSLLNGPYYGEGFLFKSFVHSQSMKACSPSIQLLAQLVSLGKCIVDLTMKLVSVYPQSYRNNSDLPCFAYIGGIYSLFRIFKRLTYMRDEYLFQNTRQM